MVALINRRLALGAFGAAILPINVRKKNTTLSVRDATDLICKATPAAFREAVRNSGNHLLYRGEDVTLTSILHPKPDLLVPGTYGDDPDALVYFQQLERMLKLRAARPSQGHIATSRAQDASIWGSVVSVWPLGTDLDYVWPKTAVTLYPGSCQNDLVIGDRLAEALERGTEILFASHFVDRNPPPNVSSIWASAFLAVPSRLDHDLIELLQERNYGLTY
jgi:hypothetical protein